MRSFFQLSIALMVLVATACNNKKADILPVRGTLDGPVTEERAPQKVQLAMKLPYADRYENILEDKGNGVSVWSLVWCNPDISSEGYGIHIVKNGITTFFPDIYHGKNPRAEYDARTDQLWLFCGVMEGTGIHVERSYIFRFDDKGTSIIDLRIDPFTVQKALCNRLSVSIKDKEISILDNGETVCTATNSITDMGQLDEDNPVWIGEQLSYYSQDGELFVRFVPGLRFAKGTTLFYDDMPELSASVSLSANGSLIIGPIKP